MNQRPQRHPAPIATATPPMEARKLAENLMEVMSALLSIIERETELVRAGKIREAMASEANKAELTRRYVNAITQLKANHESLTRTAPELVRSLHRHHETFRAMLQLSLIHI